MRIDVPASGWILAARARQHHFAGAGTLSIKTFRHGRARYRVGNGVYAVGDGQLFIVNEGQEYAIDIDAATPVSSFCVFFPPRFAARAAATLMRAPRRLLDDPAAAGDLAFFERTYRLTPAVRTRLDALAGAGSAADADTVAADAVAALERQERLHDLFTELMRLQGLARAELLAAPLDALRPATRAELYRRLWRAREYIAACAGEPLTLEQLARVACLSPNHFLRAFRQLFGLTPARWLRAARLDEARRLLRETSLPVTEVCLAVGYASLGSFSSAFRQAFGVAPSRLRNS